SKIFLDGREVDVEHKAIFMLDDYKNLHEKYFTNEISEDNYLSERIGIVLQYLQRHHSSKATHDHAVAVDRNMTGEMKQKKSYGNAAKARENLASLKTEKLETRTVRQEKDEKTEAEVQAAKNVSGEKVEAETEEAEKIQAKKNVDVGKSSLVENIETASTGKRDEWSDLLGELGAESTELTSAPPRETPSVVDKMINTGKAAVALEKKPEETKNKAENKKDPGEENNETSPTPRPRR
ncbi:MAG: hypothetical protein K0R24_56, partial [Gammaproteobacteria bacterium]|nr:hypothetical protein [Gammaproteobacteria bacterium]